MKRTLLIFFLLLSVYARADNSMTHYHELLEQANEHYKKGEFDKATELYQQIIQAHYVSADLYFNLGNAYFKQNKIPLSILYYEKAKKQKPSDPDILFNLKLANLRIVDKITPIPELLFIRWWKDLSCVADMDTWAKWSISLLFFAFIQFAFFLFVNRMVLKKLAFWIGIIFIILTIFTFTCAIQQKSLLTNQSEGIVFTPTVTVKSSPDANGTKLFVIHEGTKITIKESNNSWHKIALPDGNEGWLKKEDIVVI